MDFKFSKEFLSFTNTSPVKSYNWIPKEDITAYELALCLPVITGHNYYGWGVQDFVESLPENARRHFEEIKTK